MKRISKVLVIFLAVWLAVFNPVNISLVYAQVDTSSPSPTATDLSLPSPTDSPTSTPTDTPTDSPTPTASPDQSSTTGGSTSTVSDVTTTPTPSDTPTDSPTDLSTLSITPDPSATDSATPTDIPTDSPTGSADPSISVDQSGTTSTDTSATTDSGNNSQTGTGSASMVTGNTQSTSNSITVTNLSTVDSNLVTTIQNILTSDTGDVDLYQLLENAIAADPNIVPGGTNITVNQDATVNTNTSSTANTGGNTQNSGNTSMSTGGAVALANAITATNISDVGSNTVLAIINILADWGGNIILPDGSELSLSSGPGGVSANISQNGQVANTTSASTDTGGNTQTGKNSDLTTGNSTSTANSANLVNIIEIGNGLGYLIINNMGGWTGSLINWTAPGSSQSFGVGSYDLLASYGGAGGGGGGDTNVTVNQNANVASSVSASATTGGNSQIGKNNSMTTGAASSIANNFTLTNLASVGGGFFFGIINIFGHWTGNIFSGPKPTPDPPVDPASDPVSSTPDTRTPDLSVDIWNNVNNFVYPGDSVRSSITVSNNSPFIAHNVTVTGSITDDHPIPGAPLNWDLGDIRAGGKVKISFEVNVPKDVQTSVYHITATANGQAESGDTSSASGASNFLVEGFANFVSTLAPQVSAASVDQVSPQVLGQSVVSAGSHDITKDWPFILSGIGILYLLVIIARRKIGNVDKMKIS